MSRTADYKELLYQYEILLAKLSVREHYLKTVVRDVYENIGQVLSLIRVQLATLQTGFVNGQKEQVSSSGELVGQTIRELRTMCSFFYPEENILGDKGLAASIREELAASHPEVVCDIAADTTGLAGFDKDQSVLLFSILMEIFQLIEEKGKGRLLTFSMSAGSGLLQIIIDYEGELIWRKKSIRPTSPLHLSPFDRLQFLKGKSEIKKCNAGCRRIKLALPIHQTT